MKLDLHTHCFEATHMMAPTVDIVRRIVEQVKLRGLDGIAITEHHDKDYAYKVKELMAQHFDDEVLIIPGQEIDRFYHQVVELYLPKGGIFRFLVHPGYPSIVWDSHLDSDLHGIEIENANWPINKEKVRAVAQKHNLLMLSNSDAHVLDRIGFHYNEIDLAELYARAQYPRL